MENLDKNFETALREAVLVDQLEAVLRLTEPEVDLIEVCGEWREHLMRVQTMVCLATDLAEELQALMRGRENA